ncbi:MAG: YkgJ family cysteine cluster protein [Proteobacteria bacterium]|nr:YkgJ family cysteine cluster protein [Pseudomonadota bacterium]
MAQAVKIEYKGQTDIEKPGTWPRYKKGMCDSCMAGCCTLIVEVKASDLICLGLTDDWEVENCLKELVHRLKKQKIITRFDIKTQMFTLEQKKGSDCLFLDKNRRCRVYDKRPDVCRNHPLIVGPRKGHCPYMPKR